MQTSGKLPSVVENGGVLSRLRGEGGGGEEGGGGGGGREFNLKAGTHGRVHNSSKLLSVAHIAILLLAGRGEKMRARRSGAVLVCIIDRHLQQSRS